MMVWLVVWLVIRRLLVWGVRVRLFRGVSISSMVSLPMESMMVRSVGCWEFRIYLSLPLLPISVWSVSLAIRVLSWWLPWMVPCWRFRMSFGFRVVFWRFRVPICFRGFSWLIRAMLCVGVLSKMSLPSKVAVIWSLVVLGRVSVSGVVCVVFPVSWMWTRCFWVGLVVESIMM